MISILQEKFDDFLFVKSIEPFQYVSDNRPRFKFFDETLRNNKAFLKLDNINVSINKVISLFYDSGEDFSSLLNQVINENKTIHRILSYENTKNKYQFSLHNCSNNIILLGVSKPRNDTLDFNHQLEEELSKMVKLFRDAQRIAQLGYWDYDVHSDRLWGTKECRKILSLDPTSPILALNILKKIVLNKDVESLKNLIFNSNKLQFSTTLRIHEKETLKTLMVEGDIERDTKNCAIRIFGVLRDISDKIEKDNQLKQKLAIEQAISRISFSFIENTDKVQSLENALKEASIAVNADRAYLILLDEDKQTQELIQWNSEKSSPLFYLINKAKQLNTLTAKLALIKEDDYRANNVRDMTEIELKIFLKKLKTKSIAIQRFKRNNKTDCFLVLETLNKEKKWSENDNYLIKIAAFLINNQIKEKDYENALISSEAKYRDLFDQMRNGFILSSPIIKSKNLLTDLIILEVNPAIGAMLHEKEQALIGIPLKEIFPTSIKILLPLLQRVYETEVPESISFHLAEMNKHIEISLFLTQQEKVALIFKDISEEKKLEEQLRQVEKLQVVGQLAGGIAHDFNNQLMGIMGYGSMLESMLNDEQQLKFLKLMLISAKRSSELTRKLLDFSRKGKILSVSINIDELVVETMSMLRHTVDKKIHFRKYLRAEKAYFKGDPSQIQNALLNIGINACDAMASGGKLTIYTGKTILTSKEMETLVYPIPEGEYLSVRISDTGDGMTKDTMKKIFEPFFTTKKVNKGTGMGLAAVFGAVKEHGGGLRVRSQVNSGTIFDIYFPYDPTIKPVEIQPQEKIEIEQQVEGEVEVETTTKSAGTILILDDEEILMMMIETILTNSGFKVISFSEPNKAIKYYKQHYKQIDLVMLDFIMPEKNGTEVFSEMKIINSNLRALLLSGYSPDIQIQKLISKGILGFIQKPIDKTELLKRVKRTLQ